MSISGGQLWALNGALQNTELMTESQDLNLKRGTAGNNAKNEANSADITTMGENRRRKDNFHSINQIGIYENYSMASAIKQPIPDGVVGVVLWGSSGGVFCAIGYLLVPRAIESALRSAAGQAGVVCLIILLFANLSAWGRLLLAVMVVIAGVVIRSRHGKKPG